MKYTSYLIFVIIIAYSCNSNKNNEANLMKDEISKETMDWIEKEGEKRQQVMRDYPNLFKSISATLFKHDPIGINFGENIDEYDPEAGSIIPRLKASNTVDDVQTIVHEEFIRWFGIETAGGRDKYHRIAVDIWELWKKYKEEKSG